MHYQTWKEETHLSMHSDSPWYTSRPSFRHIVGFGSNAIPFLRRKLKEDQSNGWENGDFFLATAVVEIYDWNTAEFYESGKTIGEQEFADNVLNKLEFIQTR